MYARKPNHKLKGLALCGSSGLSTIPLSKGFFKRKNYDFVKDSTQDIFFNRTIPPEEMIVDVFNALQHYDVILRSIRFTKAATKSMMHHELPGIHVPTLLVWGKQDPITPVEVAPQFLELLPNAQLKIINECGHVPTQEKPREFMTYFSQFLHEINY
jgi:pimeloyl-ACP methyl ester carboxylesterase